MWNSVRNFHTKFSLVIKDSWYGSRLLLLILRNVERSLVYFLVFLHFRRVKSICWDLERFARWLYMIWYACSRFMAIDNIEMRNLSIKNYLSTCTWNEKKNYYRGKSLNRRRMKIDWNHVDNNQFVEEFNCLINILIYNINCLSIMNCFYTVSGDPDEGNFFSVIFWTN